ncbi:hypothetical protein [Bacillus altitudinis]|uniref:hypothetical protein n=1 Tax=Bacillus altitudinis TaxID=293387 RepID=UPI001E348446|nr:hypothetical protein [Bacillus altitudinis]
MNIKVLGIAPYKGLGDVLIDLAKDEKSITFQLEVGDLRSGVALAEQAEAQGMDIIMSRGGQLRLFKNTSTFQWWISLCQATTCFVPSR